MIELTLEQRRQFLNNHDKLVAMFGQDLVDEGLMRFSMHQLCDAYQIPLQDAYGHPASNVPSKPYHRVYISLGKKHTYHRFVNPQGWEKSVPTPVTEWQVPSQYQSNYQADYIVKPALLAMFPWLKNFRLRVYKLDFYQDWAGEFYVSLGYNYGPKGGFDCLYVPYEAFMAGDVNAVIERNQTYFTDYTKDPTVWQRMSLDPTVIAFFDHMRSA